MIIVILVIIVIKIKLNNTSNTSLNKMPDFYYLYTALVHLH